MSLNTSSFEFIEGTAIPGLSHHPAFISTEEEKELWADLKNYEKRRNGKKCSREVDDYGSIQAFYTRYMLQATWGIARRVAALLSASPDQVRIVRYFYNKGIMDHVDDPAFSEAAILTLGSSCVMHFRPKRQEPVCTRILVQPRDLYVLSGEVEKYVHGIVDAAEDVFDGKTYPRNGSRTAIIFEVEENNNEDET